jgi:tetratricopeptide (TPR) repeat protein
VANQQSSFAKSRVGWQDVLRVGLAIPALICCYVLIVNSARFGISRLLSTLSIIGSSVEPADRAVKLNPADPEAHYTRGLALVNLQRLDDALPELRLATQMRPHHYYEWLDLGVTLDRLGDSTGADAALRESIRLAPSYAQPHWQLGSFLYREGRFEEAFQELRRASGSNGKLTDSLLRLAWVPANGDVTAFLALVRPTTKRANFDTAFFLASQGRGADAAVQMRQAGEASNDEERYLIQQTVTQLLSTQQFSEALDVWTLTHSTSAKESGKAKIINGDFTSPILRGDPGFGWQLPPLDTVHVAIDTSGPSETSRSVRVEFAGDSPPTSQVMTQLVLLEPETHYSLSFMAKSEGLVTGGPPVIIVVAVNNNPVKNLGQSTALAVGTTGWARKQFDFWSGESTAVMLGLQRQQCTQSPCPIFGRLWLSEFSLAKTD